MTNKLLPFNVSGILFVSHKDASAMTSVFDMNELQIQHTEEIKLDPPIKELSQWSDDRVIATFQAFIQPGKLLNVRIAYTGGFYDKKKDLWPGVWQDERIRNLVNRSVEGAITKAGFVTKEMFDWSSKF